MEYFTFAAEREDIGTRLDIFLADAMEQLSRSGVQRLIEEGHITLNGGRAKANHKLREGDIMDGDSRGAGDGNFAGGDSSGYFI